MIKKLITILFLLTLTLGVSGYLKPDVYKIDAEKNAVMHNNLGLQALSDNNFYVAIQEFSLAILLNPKTQATSVYYNNLGETYMRLGDFRGAQGCFEKAIKQYNLSFSYYQNLVKSFKAQKMIKSKLSYYQSKTSKDPMNMLMLGLLYVNNGDIRQGIIKLDEFCMQEPDLLITGAVRSYLKSIIPQD